MEPTWLQESTQAKLWPVFFYVISPAAKHVSRDPYDNILCRVGKKCHDLNCMSFPQLLSKTIVLWTCCSQQLPIFDKKTSKTLQWFSHQRRKSKSCYFCTRTNDSQNLVESAASVAWNVVIYPDASSFRGMWAFSRPLAQFPTLITSATTDQHRLQAPEDHRWRTGIRHFQAR